MEFQMSSPKVDAEAFEALVRRSGLKLTEAQKKELLAGYGYIAAMAERVRGDGKRPREAEPSGMFKAEW
jgi:hypothetical protein